MAASGSDRVTLPSPEAQRFCFPNEIAEVFAVAGLFHEPLADAELLDVDEAAAECDLFQASNADTLAMLQGSDEFRSLE